MSVVRLIVATRSSGPPGSGKIIKEMPGSVACGTPYIKYSTNRSLLCIDLIYLFIQINLLKPTGYVMHHQLNIQQLYVLPTLYLCVLYLSENKQRLVPLTA